MAEIDIDSSNAENESTPLLKTPANSGVPQNAHEESIPDKPLAFGQIAVLCYARLMDPLAYFSIFPFVNKMIFDLGDVAEEDVGYAQIAIVIATQLQHSPDFTLVSSRAFSR